MPPPLSSCSFIIRLSPLLSLYPLHISTMLKTLPCPYGMKLEYWNTLSAESQHEIQAVLPPPPFVPSKRRYHETDLNRPQGERFSSREGPTLPLLPPRSQGLATFPSWNLDLVDARNATNRHKLTLPLPPIPARLPFPKPYPKPSEVLRRSQRSSSSIDYSELSTSSYPDGPPLSKFESSVEELNRETFHTSVYTRVDGIIVFSLFTGKHHRRSTRKIVFDSVGPPPTISAEDGHRISCIAYECIDRDYPSREMCEVAAKSLMDEFPGIFFKQEVAVLIQCVHLWLMLGNRI